MNIVQFLAHSIEEADQLRLWHALGHEVFSPGAYIDPANPADEKRPPLDVPAIAELKAVVDALGQPYHPRHGRCDGTDAHADTLEAAKCDTPDEIIDWADVLIVHHLENRWLAPQWSRLRGRVRVIWRTVGQSGEGNEQLMAPLHGEGVEIVRYSPKERHIPGFAGEDALIRFYKDPDEWNGWNGHIAVVTNVTQHMLGRDPWCNPRFWIEATRGLPTRPMGDGSEQLGGTGRLPLERMQNGLRNARAYLYTGTQPASYTLGFIEAGMTGVPIVSIGPSWMRILSYGPLLFEAHELVPHGGADDPAEANKALRDLLGDHDLAVVVARDQRRLFVEMFGFETIAAQWQAYLDGHQVVAQPAELEAVPA